MCRKLVLFLSFALVLGLIGSAPAQLPAGWQSQDIGTTGGSASESNGTWTVIGDGGDIWGASDAFHYAYVPLIGDGEISCRVVDNGTGSNTWAKGGVMIRETLEANSRHLMMIMTDSDGGGIAFQGRHQSAGAESSSFHGDVTESPPHWVRLVREGDMITGYHSDDGVDWELFTDASPDNAGGAISNPMELPMPEQVYIGLCVTSHAGGELRTYTFDNVTVGLPVIAFGPDPADGAIHLETWVSMSWNPGHTAASHDVYFGENADDVEAGTGETFLGNVTDTFFVVGFLGNPYPDGLVPGTTYYWRVDEVEAGGTKHTGYVWSFTIPPKTAYDPEPSDKAEMIDLNISLSWTAGFGTKLHYVVFGEDFDEVNNTVMGTLNGLTTYNPGPLKLANTYYWRVDEFDGDEIHKGEVWSFTTEGAVSGPNPADGAVDVKPSVVLGWVAGAVAASHDVYFGTDANAVKDATRSSPEYKGQKALGEESYDPGELTLNTTYYWRIDEVNDASPESPWPGNVWSFTTGDFFVIDDFEIYDANDNQIWYSWHDGLGYGAPGTPTYFAGNGTGSAVGDETTDSYTEETIVHGGGQSMPIAYDNNKQNVAFYSEVEKTLDDTRDWTAEGVENLSLWFRGYPASTGSFVEGPTGTFTMTGSGADIWAVDGVEADEFHFAYKMLSGTGSITARVQSIDNTNVWAKAGVMIRETLDPDSAHAMMVVTPGSGISFQRRPGTGATSVSDTTAGITAPYWVKIERDLAGNFTASSSPDGTTWTQLGVPEPIQMGANVYIGLAVTSHDADLTCQAVFTNVTTTGNVTGQWTNQDIGIASNDAEPLYVAVSNIAGNPAIVEHEDPSAVQIDTWTEWVIPLSTFADQGIVLTNVDRLAIGIGTRGNTTAPGGSGKIFVDDIRLTRPEPEPEPEPEPQP